MKFDSKQAGPPETRHYGIFSGKLVFMFAIVPQFAKLREWFYIILKNLQLGVH